MSGESVGGAAGFTLIARRNDSLPPGGRLLVPGSLAVVLLAISFGFALNGAWLVFPFAGLDILVVFLAFLRRARGIEAVDQCAHDRLLFFQQRTADRFGGMRGEHRLHLELIQPFEQLVRTDALRFQLLQHVEQRFGLRGTAFALIVSATADAMHALGRVHRLEIRGERARQRFGDVSIQTGQRFGQIVDRAALAPPTDRGGAYVLDPLEEALALLFSQHAAHHRAQSVHVFAQRAIVGQKFGVASGFHGSSEH